MAVTREKLSITIRKEVIEEFKKYCIDNYLKVSTTIESLIVKYLEKNTRGHKYGKRTSRADRGIETDSNPFEGDY